MQGTGFMQQPQHLGDPRFLWEITVILQIPKLHRRIPESFGTEDFPQRYWLIIPITSPGGKSRMAQLITGLLSIIQQEQRLMALQGIKLLDHRSGLYLFRLPRS